MIVCEKYRHIYVAIPKTGSISIHFSLGWGDDIPEPAIYHRGLQDLLGKKPIPFGVDQPQGGAVSTGFCVLDDALVIENAFSEENRQALLKFFKWSIVRNPWARLVSLYKDFTLKRVKQYSAKVAMEKPLFSEFKDFEDFCLNVGNSTWINDVFFRSQVDLLSINGKFAADWWGKFENLENDFHKACELIGIPPCPLLHMNAGSYDNTDYRQYYTPESREAVSKLYQQDVEVFKYVF